MLESDNDQGIIYSYPGILDEGTYLNEMIEVGLFNFS